MLAFVGETQGDPCFRELFPPRRSRTGEQLLFAMPGHSGYLLGPEEQEGCKQRVRTRGRGGEVSFCPSTSVPVASPCREHAFPRQSLDNNGIRVNNLGAREQRKQTNNAFFVSDSRVP